MFVVVPSDVKRAVQILKLSTNPFYSANTLKQKKNILLRLATPVYTQIV